MKSREATLSRIFVLRLEHGDRLPDSLETFCKEKNIDRAACFFLGGINNQGKLIEGPRADELPPDPVVRILSGVHEVVGFGTIFPDEAGAPSLHAHVAAGRGGRAETGCIRLGIETWHVSEVILFELTGDCGERAKDPVTGFTLLHMED